MNRNTHRFQFRGDEIGKACRAEADYHRERLRFWGDEQAAAIDRAKDAGVEVREYDGTGGKSVQIVMDPTLNQRLTECANKIGSHRAALNRFLIEGDAYSSERNFIRIYELDPDDVVYFRLCGGPREE